MSPCTAPCSSADALLATSDEEKGASEGGQSKSDMDNAATTDAQYHPPADGAIASDALHRLMQ
jgi:hypothetical protein